MIFYIYLNCLRIIYITKPKLTTTMQTDHPTGSLATASVTGVKLTTIMQTDHTAGSLVTASVIGVKLNTTIPSFWNNYCSNCGGISCFADDSSFSKNSNGQEIQIHEIKEKYSDISDYMASNRLVLNSEKMWNKFKFLLESTHSG